MNTTRRPMRIPTTDSPMEASPSALAPVGSDTALQLANTTHTHTHTPDSVTLYTVYTARRNVRLASVVLAIAIPSVRLSVCLLYAGIVSKRLYIARCSLHCQIAKCV